jgi:hypothetical protein
MDVFRRQTDQLIEPYLSKPLEEQDAVEGTRFKTRILIETDGERIVVKSGGEITETGLGAAEEDLRYLRLSQLPPDFPRFRWTFHINSSGPNV